MPIPCPPGQVPRARSRAARQSLRSPHRRARHQPRQRAGARRQRLHDLRPRRLPQHDVAVRAEPRPVRSTRTIASDRATGSCSSSPATSRRATTSPSRAKDSSSSRRSARSSSPTSRSAISIACSLRASSRVYSGVRGNNQGTTRFSVSVARLRSNQVYVVGDVRRPGSYMVSSAGTALTALYAAGGPTTNGSLRTDRGAPRWPHGRHARRLRLPRSAATRRTTSASRRATSSSCRCTARACASSARSRARRPTSSRRARRSPTCCATPGGFKATASRQRVLIERILPAAERTATGRERVTIDVVVRVARQRGGSDHSAPERRRRARLRRGRARAQSHLRRGERLSAGPAGTHARHDAEPGAPPRRASRRDTYLGEVLVTRLRPDSTRVQLRATLADTTGTVVNDFPLQEDDRINGLLAHRPSARRATSPSAARCGAAAACSIRDGMTLRDLVLLADGVQEGAYLKEAEIARLPESRAGGRTATTIRVPLDSTYLFERGPDGEYVGPPGIQVPSGGAPRCCSSRTTTCSSCASPTGRCSARSSCTAR